MARREKRDVSTVRRVRSFERMLFDPGAIRNLSTTDCDVDKGEEYQWSQMTSLCFQNRARVMHM